jgi:YidC/Oxa1 family membrane protein insertase
MNLDRNTIIGFVLLMILLFGYIFVTNQQQAAYLKEKHLKDSVENAKKPVIKKDSLKIADNEPAILQSSDTIAAGTMAKSNLPEQMVEAENDFMKIGFTSKGGYPKYVLLKNHLNPEGKPVVLGEKGLNFSYPVKTPDGSTLPSSELSYSLEKTGYTGDSIQQIICSLQSPDGTALQHIFVIRKNDYMFEWNIRAVNAGKTIPDQTIKLGWDMTTAQLEKDLKYEKGQSNIGYVENGEYDFDAAGTGDSRKLGGQTQWIGIKQQFFNATIIAPNKFSEINTEWIVPGEEADSLHQVMRVKSILNLNIGNSSSFELPLRLYFGPNDYHTLKKYNMQLESHVQLGYGIFAFVKYINRFVILPVFDFLNNYVSSIGIVILLLTFFIRLIISPLTYSSYLSGAKMKVLRPEIDELKKKYGDDQQAFSMEQMKLFRQAGVNPLGGCIPALLQIPIFFALYSFFNATLSLRGESFLWAKDLSGYDSIATLPFSIPWYGDHVSLFTITATLTSFLISLYNTQMTPQQDNPVFKYMIYIFPLMLLFIFNSLPAALTWYYTISNLVTLLLQLIIQKFIINEEKIHAQLQENKKKPVKQSKWQQKLEQMQETNKKLQDIQKKSGKK